MIIWSRWGILVFLCLGLGVGTGAVLNAVIQPTVTTGAGFTLFMGVGVVLAGIYTYLLDRYVIARHLDVPRQQVVLQRLPQPVVHPNGVRQTHQQVAVVNPQTGEPVFVRPRSSLFFIPVPIWPYVFAGLGMLMTVGSAIALLAG